MELPTRPQNAVLGEEDACGWGRRMRTAPLGPSVEFPMGQRNAVLGGGDARKLRHWDLRRSSLWGHETLYWVGRCMRTAPLGPSMELPTRPQNA
eukprot:935788-Pyramimonas_sp.AAC.1